MNVTVIAHAVFLDAMFFFLVVSLCFLLDILSSAFVLLFPPSPSIKFYPFIKNILYSRTEPS